MRVVQHWFPSLDFRRFQGDLDPPIAMDDPTRFPELPRWGEVLFETILNDQVGDRVHRVPGVPEAALA